MCPPTKKGNLVVEEVVVAYDGVAKSVGCSKLVSSSGSCDCVSRISGVSGVPEVFL